jgi:hypothetical protein
MHEIEEELMDGYVDGLYRALVDALRQAREEPFAAPVTVAEIYQDLVPYRTVRLALGFDMNADYEHTLLRLLAGEGELARIDPPEAGDELRTELRSPNPNVGLFRKFAGCDVWITPAAEALPPATTFDFATTADLGAAEAQPDAGAGAEAAPTAPGSGPAEPEPANQDPWHVLETAVAEEREAELIHWSEGNGSPGAEPEPEAAAAADAAVAGDDQLPEYDLVPRPPRRTAGAAGVAGECAFCAGALPAGRSVRFCPHCGHDQAQVPCASCGEALEREWRFCISCGTPAAAAEV